MAGRSTENENTAASELPSDSSKLPENGAEWVDLFVAEMTSATSMDDAKARASRLLEILEKSIMARAADGAAENLQKVGICLINLNDYEFDLSVGIDSYA